MKTITITEKLWDYLWNTKRDNQMKSLEEAIWSYIAYETKEEEQEK
jgi:hypothetical protein